MLKKKNKSMKIIVIGIIYFVMLLMISTAYSFLNTDLTVNATAGIASNDDYETSYLEKTKWQSGGLYFSQFDITLNYLGSKEVNGWKLYVKVPYDTEIIGCFNGSSCIVEGEILTITNESYNGSLSPNNQAVSFGFQMKTNTKDYQLNIIGAKFDVMDDFGDISLDPINPIVPVGPDDPSSGDNDSDDSDSSISNVEFVDYLIPTLKVTGGWNNTTTYILEVVNNSKNVNINRWVASIYFPIGSSISTIWGGEFEYNEETGELKLQGPSWSPSLASNSKIEVNVFMNTSYKAPYTPQLGRFKALTTDNKVVEAKMVS